MYPEKERKIARFPICQSVKERRKRDFTFLGDK